MRLTPVAAMVAICLATSPAFAAAPKTPKHAPKPVAATVAAAPVRVTSVEGVTEYRLANGLKVLLAPDASKPTATLNVTYLVGSRHESYGETGMAHLLEHLVFKGTPTLKDGALVAGLKSHGMDFNGSTTADRTNYFETFQARDENLDWALTMEADRMVNSFIARKDLDSEMTVVRNEMEAGENNPGAVLFKKMQAAAYQWHNYGKSTIGARSDVELVNIDHLQAFYRKYYQPDNAVLVLTGKFDEAKALAKIQKTFGAIAKPARVLEPTWTRDPVQDGERTVTLSRVGDYQIVAALYHIPNGPHPDVAALKVLSSVLDENPSGRLFKALVETHKAAAVGAGPTESAEPGSFSLYALVDKKGSLDEARRILFATVDEIQNHPVTEEELKRVKLSFANAHEALMNKPDALGIALSSAIAQGDWRLLFLERDQVEAVTLADLQRVAANYFKPSNRTVGLFTPTDKPERVALPAEAKPEELLKGYAGRRAVEAGEAFDPSPANIEARTHRSALANGAKLALLTKKNRGNTVNGHITLRFGDEKSLFGQEMVADVAIDMLQQGAAGLNKTQLSDKLEALKATVGIRRTGNLVSVNFEARRDTLAGLLPLLADILRRPDFPAAELETLRTRELTAIEASRGEPQAIASLALARYDNPYPKGDWRYASTLDETIAELKAVKVEELRAFHKDFLGAQDAQIALVGDFDEAAAKIQLATLFGDWKAGRAYARIPHPFRAKKPTVLKIETPEKANAFFLAQQSLPVNDEAAEAPALVLANYLLGGGGLKSRLADRIRQKEGLSYGVGSRLNLSSTEANSGLSLYAIHAPQNLAKLQEAVHQELVRFVKDGVSAQELEDARRGLLQESAIGRTHDSALAVGLAGDLWLGRTMKWEEGFEAKLRAVTTADVAAALKKYIDPDAFVGVHAGDFAKSAK